MKEKNDPDLEREILVEDEVGILRNEVVIFGMAAYLIQRRLEGEHDTISTMVIENHPSTIYPISLGFTKILQSLSRDSYKELCKMGRSTDANKAKEELSTKTGGKPK